MDTPGHQTAGAGPAGGTNRYQLALAGFVFPYVGHLIFAAPIAAAAVLIGHPWTAAVFLASVIPIDIAQQALIRRWLRHSGGVDTNKGLGDLTLLSGVRVSAYVAPLSVMAAQGGGPEMFVFCLGVMAMLGMAFSAAIVSRAVFWGFAAPVLAGAVAVALSQHGWSTIAGALMVVAALAILMTTLSAAVSKGARRWLAKHDENVAAIPELKAARARAEGARAAADAARLAASRADAAKSSFLATFSHEIRTPMNGVLGMAQLLRREETDPLKAERLDMLLESGEHLLTLVDDVLDMSKIEAGRLEIAPAQEYLRLFLDRLVGLWDAKAEQRGLTLNLDLDDSVPDTVMMDAVRLRQVLSNLISNALKFTERGAVDVRASAEQLPDDRVRLHVTVADTGPGIAPEHLPTLFDRFSQGEQSQARRFGGAGLGLAIARQIVELMDGRIWVESTPGKGSTFHVQVPLALARASAGAAPAALADLSTLAGRRVLAVDDNALNLEVVDQFLAGRGLTVTRAESGPEALVCLAEQAFDAVLMDIHMPGVTGIQVLERLHATTGPNRTTPIIALTADVTSGGRQHYLDLGFADHVAKPVQLPLLADALVRAVDAPAAKPKRAKRAKVKQA